VFWTVLWRSWILRTRLAAGTFGFATGYPAILLFVLCTGAIVVAFPIKKKDAIFASYYLRLVLARRSGTFACKYQPKRPGFVRWLDAGDPLRTLWGQYRWGGGVGIIIAGACFINETGHRYPFLLLRLQITRTGYKAGDIADITRRSVRCWAR
jgi:hypothetical protein